MEKQLSISDQALCEVVKYWWGKWSLSLGAFDTDQEMMYMVPSWIKEIVQKIEESNSVGAKFDYITGLWKN